MPNANVFYGGGHSMKSAFDFAYWCLRNTMTYYGPSSQFVLPKAKLGDQTTFSRIVGCVAQAGVTIPSRYDSLLAYCEAQKTIMLPKDAIKVRGALLFSNGIVYASMGDGKRLVYEQNFRLVLKYLSTSDDPQALFEYGAKIPGLDYL